MHARRTATILIVLGVVLQPFAGVDCRSLGAQPLGCCDETGGACLAAGAQLTCCESGSAPPEAKAQTPAVVRETSRDVMVLAVLVTPGVQLAPPSSSSVLRPPARAATDAPSPPLLSLRL